MAWASEPWLTRPRSQPQLQKAVTACSANEDLLKKIDGRIVTLFERGTSGAEIRKEP